MTNNSPKVDFNLRHYVGGTTDVLKNIQSQIRNCLKNERLDGSTRLIYSAIYNALVYYETISELSVVEISTENTFLENMVEQINTDYEYLSKKYDTPEHKVIQMKARVKSPISAMDKILEKVQEYVKEGRDLTRLNESLRDFIGIKLIVDAPPEIKAQGKQSEMDYCANIFEDLLKFHGAERQLNNENPEENDFTFIPVNTDCKPNKTQKIKERFEQFGCDPNIDLEKYDLYVPESIPESLSKLECFFKNYFQFPKFNFYQRFHTCAYPAQANKIFQRKLPKYIIPPKSMKPAIEYQVSTKSQDEWAEHGTASHLTYKDRVFHRLSLPMFITQDPENQKFKIGSIGKRMDNMKDFFGYTFKDLFNIDYDTFIHEFNTEQQDLILAGSLEVVYDKKTDEYTTKETTKPLMIYKEQNIDTILKLLKSGTEEQIHKFYEVNGLLENTIYLDKLTRDTPKIKAYKFSPAKNIKTKINVSNITIRKIRLRDTNDDNDEHDI